MDTFETFECVTIRKWHLFYLVEIKGYLWSPGSKNTETLKILVKIIYQYKNV